MCPAALQLIARQRCIGFQPQHVVPASPAPPSRTARLNAMPFPLPPPAQLLQHLAKGSDWRRGAAVRRQRVLPLLMWYREASAAVIGHPLALQDYEHAAPAAAACCSLQALPAGQQLQRCPAVAQRAAAASAALPSACLLLAFRDDCIIKATQAFPKALNRSNPLLMHALGSTCLPLPTALGLPCSALGEASPLFSAHL